MKGVKVIMKKRIAIYLLSLVMLLNIGAMPIAVCAQEDSPGISGLNIRADAVAVEVFNVPNEEPTFVYEDAHFEVTSHTVDGTLFIEMKPRRGIFLDKSTIQLFLPMDDYAAIDIKADAADMSFPPLYADLNAVVNASTLTCYLPKDFARNLAIEASASAVKVYLHEEFQDFVITVEDGEFEDISLPDGITAGGKVGNGTHTLRFQPFASSVNVEWYK